MLNKVQIIGNVGKDPEVHMGEKAVTRFSVATTERWTTNGEKKERTEWHNVTTFGKLAEICSQYLRKGRQVYVEGKIQTDKWQDKDGKDRYTTKIVASEVKFLGSKSEGETTRTTTAEDVKSAELPQIDDDDIPF